METTDLNMLLHPRNKLLIAPIWNGNALHPVAVTSVTVLLIAPIWNGNADAHRLCIHAQ